MPARRLQLANPKLELPVMQWMEFEVGKTAEGGLRDPWSSGRKPQDGRRAQRLVGGCRIRKGPVRLLRWCSGGTARNQATGQYNKKVVRGWTFGSYKVYQRLYNSSFLGTQMSDQQPFIAFNGLSNPQSDEHFDHSSGHPSAIPTQVSPLLAFPLNGILYPLDQESCTKGEELHAEGWIQPRRRGRGKGAGFEGV